MKLRDIVHKTDTPAGRTFDVVVVLLVLYSIVTLTTETVPSLPPSIIKLLTISEIVVTILFSIEYVLRIYTAPSKLKYIFSIAGLLDLVAILPFYLSLGVDLRGVRAFRLFRIFRILKLKRYNSAMSRFAKVLIAAKEEFVLFFFTTVIMLYLAAVGIYYFENAVQPDIFKSIFHSLWWAVVTLTTVGYGDAYPITAGGKIFTFVVLIIGLGIIGVPAGIISSALSQVKRISNNESKESKEKEGSFDDEISF